MLLRRHKNFATDGRRGASGSDSRRNFFMKQMLSKPIFHITFLLPDGSHMKGVFYGFCEQSHADGEHHA